MLVFFLLYFFGLYCGIQARTTYWAAGRKLLPEDMREEVMQSDQVQAFYRLDLYHAMQSQGLSDGDAADFVKKNFSPNYVLVPREWLSASKNQSPAGQQSPSIEINPQQQAATTPKPDPYVSLPEIRAHISPTPNSLEGIH